MKVILLQELKGRGGEGDVVDVARGFAVNYLLPRKVAIEATKGNLKQLGQRAHNITAREDQRLGDAQSVFDRLNGKVVRVEAKVGEEGRLFGSVTSGHIEAAIAEQLRVEIDRRKIETHGSIKEVGSHVVNVAIYRDVKAELTVEVVGEGQPLAAAPVPTTVVEVVEGVDATEGAFVEVVEETPEQVESDLALEEADAEVAETVSDEAAE
jgi:large subunit ribosomal protein L9